jgi:hypothetical protein
MFWYVAARPLQMGAQVGRRGGHVVRVHPAFPLVDAVADFAFGMAQHALPAGREEHLAAIDIPVPDAVVGAAQGQIQAFLAGRQALLGGLQIPLPLHQGIQHGVEPHGHHGRLVLAGQPCPGGVIAGPHRLGGIADDVELAGQPAPHPQGQQGADQDGRAGIKQAIPGHVIQPGLGRARRKAHPGPAQAPAIQGHRHRVVHQGGAPGQDHGAFRRQQAPAVGVGQIQSALAGLVVGQDPAAVVHQHDEHDARILALGIHQFLQAGAVPGQHAGGGGHRQGIGQGLALVGLAGQQEFLLAHRQVPDEQAHHDRVHGRHAKHQLAAQAAEQESARAHGRGPTQLSYSAMKRRTTW